VKTECLVWCNRKWKVMSARSRHLVQVAKILRRIYIRSSGSAVVRGLNVARSLRIKATFGTHLSESSTQVKRFKILTAILDVLYLDHDQLC
jgi:hypothetical protein